MPPPIFYGILIKAFLKDFLENVVALKRAVLMEINRNQTVVTVQTNQKVKVFKGMSICREPGSKNEKMGHPGTAGAT